LHREIIGLCSESHTKHINALCEQKGELLEVKPGGAQSNHKVLKVKYIRLHTTSATDKESTKKLTYFYAAADSRGGGIAVKFPFSLTNRDGNETNRENSKFSRWRV